MAKLVPRNREQTMCSQQEANLREIRNISRATLN